MDEAPRLPQKPGPAVNFTDTLDLTPWGDESDVEVVEEYDKARVAELQKHTDMAEMVWRNLDQCATAIVHLRGAKPEHMHAGLMAFTSITLKKLKRQHHDPEEYRSLVELCFRRTVDRVFGRKENSNAQR